MSAVDVVVLALVAVAAGVWQWRGAISRAAYIAHRRASSWWRQERHRYQVGAAAGLLFIVGAVPLAASLPVVGVLVGLYGVATLLAALVNILVQGEDHEHA